MSEENIINHGQHEETRWWKFYFRKSWKMVLTIPLFLFLALNSLGYIMREFNDFVTLFGVSPIGMGVLLLLGAGFILFLAPIFLSALGIYLIGVFYLEPAKKSKSLKHLKGIGVIILAILIPSLVYHAFSWILYKLLGQF